MIRGTFGVTAVVCLLVVALYGCGGSSTTGSSSAGPGTTGAGESTSPAGGTGTPEGSAGGSETSEGGAGATAEDSEATVTKAEFRKRADAICEKAIKGREAALQAKLKNQLKGKERLSRAEEEEVVSTIVLPPIEAMAEELGELPLPQEGEEQAAAVVSSFESGVEEVKANPGKMLTSNSPIGEAGELAKKYGLKACGTF